LPIDGHWVDEAMSKAPRNPTGSLILTRLTINIAFWRRLRYVEGGAIAMDQTHRRPSKSCDRSKNPRHDSDSSSAFCLQAKASAHNELALNPVQ
jgi:hypothetical protein